MTATETIKTLLVQAANGQNPGNESVKELMGRMKMALTTRSLERSRERAANYMRGYTQQKRAEAESATQVALANLQKAAEPAAD